MPGPLPPYLKRAQTKDKGIPGRKAEASIIKRLGAAGRPGSGAMDGAKGDMTKGEFLIENKSSSRDARSFIVQQAHLHKIYQEALELTRKPALAFQFVNAHGQSEKRDRWVCIPESVWQELVGE